LDGIADARISEEFAFSSKMNIVSADRDNDCVAAFGVGDLLDMGETYGRALL
jgi:hypothetical protein